MARTRRNQREAIGGTGGTITFGNTTLDVTSWSLEAAGASPGPPEIDLDYAAIVLDKIEDARADPARIDAIDDDDLAALRAVVEECRRGRAPAGGYEVPPEAAEGIRRAAAHSRVRVDPEAARRFPRIVAACRAWMAGRLVEADRVDVLAVPVEAPGVSSAQVRAIVVYRGRMAAVELSESTERFTAEIEAIVAGYLDQQLARAVVMRPESDRR